MTKIFTAIIAASLLFEINAQTFNPLEQPPSPDYSQTKNWLTLPFRNDGADIVLKGEKPVSDSSKAADVFYIYPTIYKHGKTWCADVANKKLNKKIERLPVKYQAVPFNHVARIYTPLYRQGKIKCFYNINGVGGEALNFAYTDVKRAFEYYLQNFNEGRPIIIVSHSQGTLHARQLLKDFFDTPDMKKRLVCAYTIGYAMFPENYEVLQPCLDANETNCYLTWSSFKKGFDAKNDTLLYGKVCVNPISWTCDTTLQQSNCAILLNINTTKPFETQAQIRNNHLAINTKTPIVRNWKVMHLVDFNLFWESIRKNVAERVANYLKTTTQ